MTASLAPHHRSEIEWWYLHGMLEDRYLLMLCFWRYRGARDLPEGIAASYALTPIEGGHRVLASLIDPAFLRQIRAIVTQVVHRSPDPYLESFLEASAAGRVFAPYRMVEDSAVRWDADSGLALRMGPCLLRHDPAARRMWLEIADRDLNLTITLDTDRPGFPMGRGGAFDLAGKRMQGWTHPRLPASGRLARQGVEQAVTGTFWLDHQWGAWSFANPRRHFHHPEWLYFAAVLDDGRALVIFQYKQPRRDRRAKRFAYILLQEADGTSRPLEQAGIVTHGRLESLRTNNLYEYGWTVELPEIGGRLEFEPFHGDQEVYVFTRQRGILELGCRVRGHLDGAAATGWGFVEVFGDTLDINEFFWGQDKTNLAWQLERFLPRIADGAWLQRICQLTAPLALDAGALDQAIFTPLWSMMDRGGKGWRSAWLTTCYYAYDRGELDEQIRQLLPVTELLHTGSLIIDDIQDGATLRRRRPALHVEVGTDIAINAGCFCYFLPLLIIEELPGVTDRQRALMYGIVANALRQGHIGQAMDLMWSHGRCDVRAKVEDFDGTRAQLVEQYRLKSGCQLEAIARIAGVLAEAPAALVETTAAYSRVFGVVFQIVDDIIGIQEGHEALGKDDGEDLRNRKLNMVLLYALSAVRGGERERWIRRLFDADGRNGQSEAHRLIDATESIPRCLDYAESLMRQAWEPMEILPPSDAKIVMRSVPQWLLRQRRARAGGPHRSV